MGRTSKPLIIAVAPQWRGHPQVVELREKGHTILGIEDAATADLILSDKASRWEEGLWPYLEITIKKAREQRYGKVRSTDEAVGGAMPGPDSANAR